MTKKNKKQESTQSKTTPTTEPVVVLSSTDLLSGKLIDKSIPVKPTTLYGRTAQNLANEKKELMNNKTLSLNITDVLADVKKKNSNGQSNTLDETGMNHQIEALNRPLYKYEVNHETGKELSQDEMKVRMLQQAVSEQEKKADGKEEKTGKQTMNLDFGLDGLDDSKLEKALSADGTQPEPDSRAFRAQNTIDENLLVNSTKKKDIHADDFDSDLFKRAKFSKPEHLTIRRNTA